MRPMRVVLAALLLSLIPVHVRADNDRGVEDTTFAPSTSPVIGGTAAPLGKWPDVAAVNDPSGDQACTGTLIAPNVVLTAGHCMDIPPASVVVGTASLARLSDGEVIAVSQRFEYPNSFRSYDVGVLVLANSSRFAPRAIATGWARLDITNGAAVAIAGYGATDRDANMFTSTLQEATTSITDADCTTKAGCNTLAQPAGELGAGGMGIDTCPGDSGGPLYLVTDYGTFLAGVTSRGYNDNNYYCSEGGIYARPDKIVDWIEEVSGIKVARGPEPSTSEPLVAIRGHAAEAQVVANDPKGTSHTFAITTPPGNGTAAIRDDGLLRVCTRNDVAGIDTLVVTVTDKTDPSRSVAVTLPVEIQDGDPGEDCDPEEFGDSGGCCDSGRSSGGAIPLALGVLVILGRRRRTR